MQPQELGNAPQTAEVKKGFAHRPAKHSERMVLVSRRASMPAEEPDAVLGQRLMALQTAEVKMAPQAAARLMKERKTNAKS